MTTLNQLDTEPFMNIEVALRFFYMMGEVMPDKVMISFLYIGLMVVIVVVVRDAIFLVQHRPAHHGIL